MTGRVLVAGAGGFIGGHLSQHLCERGYSVRCVDIQPISKWHQCIADTERLCLDLRNYEDCRRACDGVSEVYNLAARMGGIGEIESHRCDCAMNIVITAHMLQAAHVSGVDRFFWSSSACVYAADKQSQVNGAALREGDAYPASPEVGYGEEKLFGERLCQLWREDYGLETRVARYHNIMGTHGTWRGGREKAPAAICRKVAQAKLFGRDEIEIWGDGEQRRSFCWIGDCIKGTDSIMHSDIREPINLGSSELVSINEMVSMVEWIAGVSVKRHYLLDAPKGVRGRNSDNTLIRSYLDWEPTTKLYDGLCKVYAWVEEQLRNEMGLASDG